MGLRRIVSVFVLVSTVAPASGQAQTLETLEAGDRIRIETASGAPTAGTLLTLGPDSLAMATDRTGTTEVAITDLTLLQLGVGRQPMAGANRGGAVGLVGGVLLGALITYFDDSPGVNFALITVPVVTIPVGAVLGGLFFAPWRYVDVPLPHRL